jgi:hypothetical protein
VLGVDLSKLFPLPRDKTIEKYLPNFHKKLNGIIAEKMLREDIVDTDFGKILGEISDKVGN